MALDLWIVFVLKLFHGGVWCMPSELLLSNVLFLQKDRWCQWGQGETSNEKQDKEHKEEEIKN